MKIIVFGARGDVGSRAVAEAMARGHAVTAVVRTLPQSVGATSMAKTVIADVSDTRAVADLLAGQDLAISAIRPPEGKEADLVTLTGSILAAAAKTGTRVLIVGGAASLYTGSEKLHSVLTAPGFLPDEIVPIARACFAQFETVLADRQADWTYLAPPAMLTPGQRTGRYQVGDDTLLFDETGRSGISMEDLSVALIDEAETPAHRRARFTVAH